MDRACGDRGRLLIGSRRGFSPRETCARGAALNAGADRRLQRRSVVRNKRDRFAFSRRGWYRMRNNTAAFAAHRAYIKALTVGAAAYTAFDVACAAYRASWPGLDDSELRNT